MLIRVEFGGTALEALKRLVESAPEVTEGESLSRLQETGGILIGRQSKPGVVTVEEIEEIPSDHQRGASFTLSSPNRKSLGYRLHRIGKQGRTVVGYFRTHTRRGFYLDLDDRAVIRDFFSEPSQLVLLAKPAGPETPLAAVFLWEEGEVEMSRPAWTFPLDRSALAIVDKPAVRPAATPETLARPVVGATSKTPWTPIVAAMGLIALTAVFVPARVFNSALGVRHREQPAKVTVARQPAVPAKTAGPVGTPPPVNDTPVAPEFEAAAPPPAAKPAPRRRAAPANPVPVLMASAIGPKPAEILERAEPELVTVAPPPEVREEMTVPARPTIHPSVRPEVSLQPVHRSLLHRTFRHIPLLSKLDKHRDEDRRDFIPAHPLKEGALPIPANFGSVRSRAIPVDLRLRISPDGKVAETELLSTDSDPVFASLAMRAAARWDFEPARMKDKAVASEMLVQFRFPGSE